MIIWHRCGAHTHHTHTPHTHTHTHTHTLARSLAGTRLEASLSSPAALYSDGGPDYEVVARGGQRGVGAETEEAGYEPTTVWDVLPRGPSGRALMRSGAWSPDLATRAYGKT